jgi:hypothetical protein
LPFSESRHFYYPYREQRVSQASFSGLLSRPGFDIPRTPIEDELSCLMTEDSRIAPLRAGLARLRRGALWVIFALVLIIPKANRLRRHRRGWNFGRLITGLAGIAVLARGAASGHHLALLVTGAVLLLLALALAPKRADFSIDERARQLGALIVVDGGRYVDGAGKLRPAKLFIGPDRLWVLNPALQVLLELPLIQIRALTVEPADAVWRFRLDCNHAATEFLYEGSFAEHLARVADETLRSQLYRELPVLR